MKINLDFYKEKQEELEPIDEQIVKIIKENKQEEYETIMKQNNEIEIIMALSEIRKNILNWYPFEKNANILEIEPNFGEITGMLCEKASRVVAIESSLEKAKAIEKRHLNKENLEIIVGKIEEIKLNEKFDYIILIGILEKLDTIFEGKIEEYFEYLKPILKENGKIILATDNRLGIKYFSKTDKTGINVVNNVDKKLYTLEEILGIIKNVNMIKNNIYYPMPDYKLTNVIFTDNKLLSKKDLSRNIVYNSEDTIKFYQENLVYRELLKENNNMFKIFANSYLIEITNVPIEEKTINFVSFSNMRKPQYRIKTIMEKEKVYKYALNDNSKEHIEKIKRNIDIMKSCGLKTVDNYEENKVISKYTDAQTLDEEIMNLMNQNKRDEAIKLIKKFREEIQAKLEKTDSQNNVFDKYEIQYNKEDIEQMHFVKYGLWDLIFQNCFYIDNEFYFYDQEWQEENTPISFILYRAIKYFSRIKKYMSDEELYEIMQIDLKNIKLFDELDNKIQLSIRNELMWNVHTQGLDVIELKRKELTANHQINVLKTENNEKQNIIEQKDIEIENLKKDLQYVYNSRSWKLTRPLRKIIRLGRNKMN